MTLLSSDPAWKRVLESLRAVFQNKPVYLRNRPFFVFVCGGELGQGKTTLRQQFLQWAEHELPNFFQATVTDRKRIPSRQRRLNMASTVADATRRLRLNYPALKGRAKLMTPLRGNKRDGKAQIKRGFRRVASA